jgi:hypothetical protein
MAAMSCSHFQDQMLLLFGQERLPEELRSHLAECPSCRAVWEELTDVSEKLGGDDLFFPKDAQVEQWASKVDAAIEEIERDNVPVVTRIRKSWYERIPIAAAAALVLGIAIGTYMGGRTAFDTGEAEIASGITGIAGLYEGSDEELQESTVGSLIYDFTAQHSYEASEWLLDDLTEEELDFLEKNFDVGDLL